MPLRSMVSAALFAAILAILAQIAIPLPFSPVPLTAQLLGVFLAGALLGSKTGSWAVLIYLLLGAAGAPVFANARGGLQVIAGPSGGYLLGFLPGVWFLGKITEKAASPGCLRLICGMVGCLLLSYAPGSGYLALWAGYNLPQAISAGIIPFLPLDLLKIVLAVALARTLRRRLRFLGPAPWPRSNKGFDRRP